MKRARSLRQVAVVYEQGTRQTVYNGPKPNGHTWTQITICGHTWALANPDNVFSQTMTILSNSRPPADTGIIGYLSPSSIFTLTHDPFVARQRCLPRDHHAVLSISNMHMQFEARDMSVTGPVMYVFRFVGVCGRCVPIRNSGNDGGVSRFLTPSALSGPPTRLPRWRGHFWWSSDSYL